MKRSTEDSVSTSLNELLSVEEERQQQLERDEQARLVAEQQVAREKEEQQKVEQKADMEAKEQQRLATEKQTQEEEQARQRELIIIKVKARAEVDAAKMRTQHAHELKLKELEKAKSKRSPLCWMFLFGVMIAAAAAVYWMRNTHRRDTILIQADAMASQRQCEKDKQSLKDDFSRELLAGKLRISGLEEEFTRLQRQLKQSQPCPTQLSSPVSKTPRRKRPTNPKPQKLGTDPLTGLNL